MSVVSPAETSAAAEPTPPEDIPPPPPPPPPEEQQPEEPAVFTPVATATSPVKVRDEVVNCICHVTEETGLMMQCDVCLCWQHAVCMELDEDTLPSRYVCFVCSNAPGQCIVGKWFGSVNVIVGIVRSLGEIVKENLYKERRLRGFVVTKDAWWPVCNR